MELAQPLHSPPGDLETLVRAAQRGSREAFDTLVQRHCGMVFSIGFARLKNREAAEDLVQEVFVRIHLNLNKLSEPRFFATWVSRIARNLATDWVRRNQRTSALLTMVPMPKSSAPINQIREQEVRTTLEENERLDSANAAIMSLPDEQREIVMLHYSEGMTLKEIAALQGVHPSTVGRQLNQALEMVRASVLEPLLRDSSRKLGAPTHLAVRTVATAAVVAGLTGEAKTALASAATIDAAMQAAHPMAVTAGAAEGFWQSLQSAVMTTAKALLTAKGAAIAVTSVAAVTAGVALTESHLKSPSSAPETSAQSTAATAANNYSGTWPAGVWVGTLTFPGAKAPIHIVYGVGQKADGSFTAKAYSPDQGVAGITSDIQVTPDSFKITMSSLRAEFAGNKKMNGDVVGEFKQMGKGLPLTLRRTESTAASAPQKPVIASDPQSLKEFTGRFASDPRLTATVTLDEKGLVVAATQQEPTRLLQESPTDFRFENDPVTVRFGRNAAGQIDRVSFKIEIAGVSKSMFMRRLQ